MTKDQLKRAGEVFEADLARDLENPESARISALRLAKLNPIADILDAIEAARREQHLPKARSAAGWTASHPPTPPAASSKPHVGHVDLAYAVDLELTVKVKNAPTRRATPEPVKVLLAA